MKAVNLEQAIRFFDPRKPLTGAELNYWFIERQDTPRYRLEAFLRSQLDPVKLLFIGPRGSGKTTELNKLKVDLEAARAVFRDRAATITAPHVMAIFTFPNALRFSDDFDTIRRNFADCHVFPHFALRRRDGSPDPDGPSALRRLVLARLDEDLIDPGALEQLVQASGGQPTSLVALVRDAAVNARARRRPPEQVTGDDAEIAVTLLRRNLVGPLSRQDYATLHARHLDRRLTNEPQERRLLYNGTLLEYGNGEPWCDAHPVLWPLLKLYGERASSDA